VAAASVAAENISGIGGISIASGGEMAYHGISSESGLADVKTSARKKWRSVMAA